MKIIGGLQNLEELMKKEEKKSVGAKKQNLIVEIVKTLNLLLNQDVPEAFIPAAARRNADARLLPLIENRIKAMRNRSTPLNLVEERKLHELKRKYLQTCYPELPKMRRLLGRFNIDGTSSRSLVAMNRYTGKLLWTYEAEHSIRHNAIAMGGGKVFLIDRQPDMVLNTLKRRGQEFTEQLHLVALDAVTGGKVWSTSENVFGTWLGYSAEHDALVQAGRRARDSAPDEQGRRMIVYRGADGDLLWDETHTYGGPIILRGDTIIAQGNAFNLLTGKVKNTKNPINGRESRWDFRRNYGCNSAIGSTHLLTFRSAAAGYYDLENESGTGNFGGFRSSCTSNLIVANGVLNAPDYTRTCRCSYQNQSSLAMINMPEVETWTFSSIRRIEGVVQRLGVNLGAPGDRRGPNGTMWFEYPIVGGPSPPLPVKLVPERPGTFCFHSSRINGNGDHWIAASGLRGVEAVSLRLFSDELPAEALPYTVRLTFVEPDGFSPGERVFDVAINGTTVLEDFDIAREVGSNRSLSREFRRVQSPSVLTVSFTPSDPQKSGVPVLCGIEVAGEFGELSYASAELKKAGHDFRFLKDWRISRISKPTGGSDRGLADPLPAEAARPVRDLKAQSNAYLDMTKIWEEFVPGEKLVETFQCAAESWAFSPAKRRVEIGFGPDYWGRVAVNGKECLAVIQNRKSVNPNVHKGKAELKAGWNKVRVRLSSGSKGMGFWLSMFEPLGLQFASGDEPPAWPKEWEVHLDEGTFVNETAGKQDRNYGQQLVFYMSGQEGKRMTSFISWPRDLAPEELKPVQIRARITLIKAWSEGSGKIRIRPILEKWDDNDTNFLKQPKLGQPLPIELNVESDNWTFTGSSLDELVRRWIAEPKNNHGVAIESDVKGFAAFYSDNEARAPRLRLEHK